MNRASRPRRGHPPLAPLRLAPVHQIPTRISPAISHLAGILLVGSTSPYYPRFRMLRSRMPRIASELPDLPAPAQCLRIRSNIPANGIETRAFRVRRPCRHRVLNINLINHLLPFSALPNWLRSSAPAQPKFRGHATACRRDSACQPASRRPPLPLAGIRANDATLANVTQPQAPACFAAFGIAAPAGRVDPGLAGDPRRPEMRTRA
jgi:hypothetical protein